MERIRKVSVMDPRVKTGLRLTFGLLFILGLLALVIGSIWLASRDDPPMKEDSGIQFCRYMATHEFDRMSPVEVGEAYGMLNASAIPEFKMHADDFLYYNNKYGTGSIIQPADYPYDLSTMLRMGVVLNASCEAHGVPFD